MSNLDLLAAAGNSIATASGPEGVSFDEDNMVRSSDFTGNSDSTTTTVSFFFYVPFGDNQFTVYRTGTTYIVIDPGSNSAGCTVSLYFDSGSSGSPSELWSIRSTVRGDLPLYTVNHVLLSFNRATDVFEFYLNDREVTSSYAHEYATTSATNFTNSTHYVATTNGSNFHGKGRLSNLFLDYTYRDLSIEANRRLFIDADGFPVDASGLSPILYLPMTDADTAGDNSGTGGDFTINGVLDTAQRGANQWNCVASEFDGSADYVGRTDTVNSSTTDFFTLSLIINKDVAGSYTYLIDFRDKSTNNQRFMLQTASGALQLDAKDGSNNNVLRVNFSAAEIPVGKECCVTISAKASTQTVHTYINGISGGTPTWFSTNEFLTTDFGKKFVGCANGSGNYFDGVLGELYFHPAYTDLSADNPFWDADNNIPKPVAQVIEETGTTPLIALPIRGDDAGNNLGTGGDFTVYSGPFTGARGGSEYWQRSVYCSSASDYLSLSAPFTDSKIMTAVVAVQRGTSGTMGVLDVFTSGDSNSGFFITYDATTGYYYFKARNASDTAVLDAQSHTVTADGWHVLLFSIDLSDSGKRHCFVDGTDSATWSTYTNSAMNIDRDLAIGLADTNAVAAAGNIGFVYLDDSYIDFSQESNRNLFIDQLGFPKNLQKQIDDGVIAEPLIYMPFDDTDALGTNNGTGGNFTVNGTVTAGADVNP